MILIREHQLINPAYIREAQFTPARPGDSDAKSRAAGLSITLDDGSRLQSKGDEAEAAWRELESLRAPLSPRRAPKKTKG